MQNKQNSILVVGFNTRPLVFSLYEVGYKVYSVDFFGDMDLYPYVEDSIIITERLKFQYKYIKDFYKDFVVQFTFEMIERHSDISSVIIASGLDDEIHKRQEIYDFLEKKGISNLNNNLISITQARNIQKTYQILENQNFKVPLTYKYSLDKEIPANLSYPFILKKLKSSGGINVHKIKSEEELLFREKLIKSSRNEDSDYIIQEYIKGIPVSCTTISDGIHSEVISINRQIIGLNILNPPDKFYYNGNVVPAYLLPNDKILISQISIFLTEKFNLQGINGFDFVVKDHYPYLMEINPRIPGSIRASEEAYNVNLLDLHIKCFTKGWDNLKKSLILREKNQVCFATKLVYFAPKDIQKSTIKRINNLDYVHDKSTPDKIIKKNSPVCTILYKDKNFASSFFGALKVVDEINGLILKKKET
ncbi:MAG: ATP-grasp domain-containing protein [Promethearchaeota archaeon]|nr:MAG: ATP-grasp domain-containing protein [Candidatus Lokiarchaeota archaeon]